MAFGFPAYHTQQLQLREDGPPWQDRVAQAITALGWTVHTRSDESVHATVKLNFRSWGEKIRCQHLGHSTLTITSQCALPTQCLDWGRNRTNVMRLVQALEKEGVRPQTM